MFAEKAARRRLLSAADCLGRGNYVHVEAQTEVASSESAGVTQGVLVYGHRNRLTSRSLSASYFGIPEIQKSQQADMPADLVFRGGMYET